MTVFLVDNGDTFEGTAAQADECYGISRDIEDWSDKQVVQVLSEIFPGSLVSIKGDKQDRYIKDEPFTAREIIDRLSSITDQGEFRRFVDTNVVDLFECVNVKYPEKLKRDVAGLLYIAIHGSTDAPTTTV